MATEENETSNDWADKHNDVISGSPTMSVGSSGSGCGSNKFDLEFSVGQKIEVRDYRTDMWYLAKIMEVDYDDHEIFIHYEKWSQRFDEWMKWDSQRIRRVSQTAPTSQFKIGDSVMATWNGTRKYPAVIQNILPDDKYEVKFYDGFVKVIRGNRIAVLSPTIAQSIMSKLPKDKPPAPRVGSELDVANIGTKEERREKKRRINVAEIFHPMTAASNAKKRKLEEVEGETVASPSSPASRTPHREEATAAKEKGSSRRSRGGAAKGVAAKEETPAAAPVVVKKNTEKKRRSSRYKEEPKIKNDGNDVKAEAKEEETKAKSDVKIEPGFEPEKYPLEENKDEDNELTKLKDAVVMVEKVEPNAKDEKSSDETKTNIEKDNRSEPVQESNDTVVSNQITESGPDKTTESGIKPKTEEKRNAKDVKLKDILPIISVNRTSALRRVRIPKVKTSLGSSMSSSFPKVKIAPITKSHNRSLTSRGGRVLKKKIPGGGFDESNVSESIYKTNTSETLDVEKQQDDIPPKIPKIKISIDKSASNAESDHQESAVTLEPNTPAVEVDVADTKNQVKEEKVEEESGVKDESVRRKSKKKKGKKMRHGRSKHKSDDSGDIKDWKLNRRRKGDDEDDPERWDGDVPGGAKPVFIDGGDGKMRQSVIIPDKKLPAGWSKHTIIRKNSSKWDVLLVNPNGRKFRSRKDLRVYYNEMNKDYPEDRFDFVVGRTKLTTSLIEQAAKSNRSPKRSSSSSSRHVHKSGGKKSSSKEVPSNSLATSSSPAQSPATPTGEEKKIKTLLPKAKSTPLASTSATNFTDEIVSPLPTVGLPSLPSGKGSPLTAVTPKAGPLETSTLLATPVTTPLSEEGTGSCQCPKEGCGKNFRKESLLQMHIKHYHPEYSGFLDGALNVADLAYARTVGEQLDGDCWVGGDGGGGGGSGTGDHHSSSSSSFLERITQYEQSKAAAAAKAAVASAATAARTKSAEVAAAAAAAVTTGNRRRSATGPASSAAGAAASAGAQSPLRKALMKGLSFSPERLAEDHADSSKKSTSLLSTTGTPTGQTRPESTPLDTDGECRTAVDPNERSKPEEVEKGGSDSRPGRDSLKGSHTPPPRQKYHSEGATPDSPKTPRNPSYRFARNKPIVSIEKLNLTPDSNGRVLLDKKGQDLLKSEKSDSNVDSVDLPAEAINTTETEVVDVINKKEEIINCMCGYPEEDGLMIQCDLCLCWQHGLCNNISTDSEVPEKYICYICLHSKHSRSSRKYMHNQEWLKDGKLPLLSFRQHDEEELKQRETLLKRSHELVSTLLQLKTVVKSLRLKTHIAGKSDHPKLYLWSKSWDKDEKEKQEIKTEEKELDSKEAGEEIKKEEDDTAKKVPNIPVPEAPIDLVECRLRLLEHIENYQLQIDDRLSSLDAQVSALEAMDPDLTDEETDDFYPRSKQTVQMLLNDLGTLRQVTAFN